MKSLENWTDEQSAEQSPTVAVEVDAIVAVPVRKAEVEFAETTLVGRTGAVPVKKAEVVELAETTGLALMMLELAVPLMMLELAVPVRY